MGSNFSSDLEHLVVVLSAHTYPVITTHGTPGCFRLERAPNTFFSLEILVFAANAQYRFVHANLFSRTIHWREEGSFPLLSCALPYTDTVAFGHFNQKLLPKG